MTFPQIDPVIFTIYGPIALRWYNLAYILGLGGGWYYCKRIVNHYHLKKFSGTVMDDAVIWAVIGIIVGGRLGYAVFYDLRLFFVDPLQLLRVWEGGMSFHGALLGTIISMRTFAWRKNVPFMTLMDLIVAAAPIGIFLGRIANFINDELYGRVTTVPWAVIFPSGGFLMRHPSQLYEAFLEGIVLFSTLSYFLYKKNALKKPGLLSGIFLIGYGLARFSMEFFREPDGVLSFQGLEISMGQALSIPMVIKGIFLVLM